MNALAPGLLHAQEVAINGKDFESGAGDAKLAEIARQAAASGKTIVVTSPPYWQDKAVAKLRAGSSSVHVKTSDAFFENVLVRVVASDPAVKPVAEPAPKVAEMVRAPKPAERPAEIKPAETKPAEAPVIARAQPARAEPPTAEPAKPLSLALPATAPAPVTPPPAAAPSRSVAKVNEVPAAAQRAVVPQPPPAPAATAPVPAAVSAGPTSVSVAEARQRLQSQLGSGKSVDGTLKAEQLRKDDQIFVQGPARVVVRRNGARTQLFWLEGTLNLERAEISRSDAGRYRVDEPIRNVAAPTLRAMHSQPLIFVAQVPAQKTSIRSDMERHFNDAKQIAEQLHPDQLQYGDLFYVYRKYAVVFRRTDLGFDRYWLDGQIDLNQAGIVRDGDAYRLVSDRL